MNGFILRYWRHGDRFLVLLVLLVATLLLMPIIDSPLLAKSLGNACMTLIFVVGAMANRHRRVIFRLAIGLAVLAILLNWGRWVVDTENVMRLRLAVDVVFFVFTAVMILVAVFRDHLASRQAISGAICVYLLLGFAWAHGYLLIERLEPESFSFSESHRTQAGEADLFENQADASLSEMVYYSFVTMTTLGYGDITPRTPPAQTLTWMQAVTGQLYIAVLIARMIGELPRIRRSE